MEASDRLWLAPVPRPAYIRRISRIVCAMCMSVSICGWLC